MLGVTLEYRRTDEIALLEPRDLDGTAVQFQFGAFAHAFGDQIQYALLGVLRDHGTQVRTFLHARIDL
jgi:hypothetical protein